MGKGESGQRDSNRTEASQAHDLSSRQKEDRGGCTCTLEEVQSGEEEIGDLAACWSLLRICGRLSAFPKPSQSVFLMLTAWCVLSH